MPDQPTKVYQIDPSHPEPAMIEEAASLLRAGKLVVFPTETVYGLGADALQPVAVEHIFAAKGRPYSDPLIAHIADEEALERLVSQIPAQARLLAQRFWPGPLTLILPAGARVPKLVTAGLETIAVRMPRHPVALALIRATGSPIAAPSANRFMHVSPTTAQHALADLKGRVPLILDGGACEVGVESTILDLCGETPTILRPGGVSLEALRAVLPAVQPPRKRQIGHAEAALPGTDQAHVIEEAQKAPGQMLMHYAPAIPAFLVEGQTATMRATMQAEIQRRRARGEEVGLLVADEDLAIFQETGAYIYTLGKEGDPEQVATRLFAGLRVLEEAGVQVILCRNFEEEGLGLAIRDRLLKATGGKIL